MLRACRIVLFIGLVLPLAFLLRAQLAPGEPEKNLAERLGYPANSRLPMGAIWQSLATSRCICIRSLRQIVEPVIELKST